MIFIPVNVPGLFRLAYAPSEFFPYINTPGKDFYSLLVRDMEPVSYTHLDVYKRQILSAAPKAETKPAAAQSDFAVHMAALGNPKIGPDGAAASSPDKACLLYTSRCV